MPYPVTAFLLSKISSPFVPCCWWDLKQCHKLLVRFSVACPFRFPLCEQFRQENVGLQWRSLALKQEVTHRCGLKCRLHHPWEARLSSLDRVILRTRFPSLRILSISSQIILEIVVKRWEIIIVMRLFASTLASLGNAQSVMSLS